MDDSPSNEEKQVCQTERKMRRKKRDRESIIDQDGLAIFNTVLVTLIFFATIGLVISICVACTRLDENKNALEDLVSRVAKMERLLETQSALLGTISRVECPYNYTRTEKFGCLDTTSLYKKCYENGGELRALKEPHNGVAVECTVRV